MSHSARLRTARLARVICALLLGSAGAALAVIGFRGELPRRPGPRLSLERPLPLRARNLESAPSMRAATFDLPTVSAPAGTPTFGQPIISGIGGSGFEQDLRVDPSNPSRIYTSAPGTLSANTSWIWRSLDGGRTFKWIPNGAPLEGKVTACNGGGDTELAVDSAGRLYFNDLTLANFSTGRSDDFGATFACSNTGVPDTAVDRQWYALDGDPLNGGSLYLANDEIGPGGVVCGGSTGNNVLVMYRSPVTGAGATAGIEFGPANHVSAVGSCDEAIMGNNEVSPVATTLGQPNGQGGYATLATPVKHVFVVHDNATLDKILVGRCFPVAFGAAGRQRERSERLELRRPAGGRSRPERENRRQLPHDGDRPRGQSLRRLGRGADQCRRASDRGHDSEIHLLDRPGKHLGRADRAQHQRLLRRNTAE